MERMFPVLNKIIDLIHWPSDLSLGDAHLVPFPHSRNRMQILEDPEVSMKPRLSMVGTRAH